MAIQIKISPDFFIVCKASTHYFKKSPHPPTHGTKVGRSALGGKEGGVTRSSPAPHTSARHGREQRNACGPCSCVFTPKTSATIAPFSSYYNLPFRGNKQKINFRLFKFSQLFSQNSLPISVLRVICLSVGDAILGRKF